MESPVPGRNERPVSPIADLLPVAMTMHHTHRAATTDDQSLGRLAGACAVIGVGVVAAALLPNPVTSPVIIARCAFEAGRILGRR